MRIFAASDIHFEFHNAIDWLPPMPEPDAFDVMVLAGDIGTSLFLGAGLRRLRKRYPEKPIILVAGNHEYYGKSIKWDVMAGIDVPGVYFLDNQRLDLMGYHFLGSTLWTGFNCMGEKAVRQSMKEAWNHITDFICIRGEPQPTGGLTGAYITAEYMAELYYKARRWLSSELQSVDTQKTIVTTHFPPTRECRHKEIEESLITGYFQANCMDIIEQYQPALWIYGHNHYSDSHNFRNTLVISNQFGYPSENTGYRGDWIIEV